jgi:glyoxylase-like metal-dependent hydrolase (beta-lactamase superfamily II)
VQPVPEFEAITCDLAIWHSYNPEVRAELFSTFLVTGAGAYLIDPIPLQKQALEELVGSAPVAGIVITNSNHHRAAVSLAERFGVPIFAHPETFSDDRPVRLRIVCGGGEISDKFRVIAINGAAPGEVVLHYAGNGGTLIVGDALMNFEPHGFTFLPAKYCSNQTEMRRSLRKVLDYQTERILFAHGTPILSRASERMRDLIDSGS